MFHIIRLNKTVFISFLALSFIISSFSISISGVLKETDSLFQSEDVLQIELWANFNEIQDDRGDSTVYHEAVLKYNVGGDGGQVELPVRIKARGNFRRSPDVCKFPPLMLNFKKKAVENTLFDKQDKLKLVTPCQIEEDVLEEYLIYKMYNEVTDYSLNVRLVKILYFNTHKNKKLFEKFSFIIEDIDRAAKRNKAKEFDTFTYPFDLNVDNVKRMSMFQFMVGNKDWYFTTRHNVYLLQPKDSAELPIAIPYDFDFSAFIDAIYTKPQGVPDEMLENRRVYKGMCYSPEEFADVISYFDNLRPGFHEIIESNEQLGKYAKKMCIKYISDFYDIVHDKESFESTILEECKTRKDYIKFE